LQISNEQQKKYANANIKWSKKEIFNWKYKMKSKKKHAIEIQNESQKEICKCKYKMNR
jgi:hypothetical protein